MQRRMTCVNEAVPAANNRSSNFAFVSLQAISIAVSSELPQQPGEANNGQQQQQQPGAQRKLPGSFRPLHRPPDPAAAVRWLQGEDRAADDVDMVPSVAGQRHGRAPAPRITVDPALQAQQLAGWVRVGVDGAAAGEAGQAAGLDAGGGVDEVMSGGEEEVPADDFVDDEEEWI